MHKPQNFEVPECVSQAILHGAFTKQNFQSLNGNLSGFFSQTLGD